MLIIRTQSSIKNKKRAQNHCDISKPLLLLDIYMSKTFCTSTRITSISRIWNPIKEKFRSEPVLLNDVKADQAELLLQTDEYVTRVVQDPSLARSKYQAVISLLPSPDFPVPFEFRRKPHSSKGENRVDPSAVYYCELSVVMQRILRGGLNLNG